MGQHYLRYFFGGRICGCLCCSSAELGRQYKSTLLRSYKIEIQQYCLLSAKTWNERYKNTENGNKPFRLLHNTLAVRFVIIWTQLPEVEVWLLSYILYIYLLNK